MTIMTRADGDITVVVPATGGGFRYAVAAPLATYTGTVDSLYVALFFALTGYYPDEVGPDDQVSLCLDPDGRLCHVCRSLITSDGCGC